MTVREMLLALQTLPRDAELLVFEAGCEDYCEREVDEVEWQGVDFPPLAGHRGYAARVDGSGWS
jgi:hypothetical protein